MSIFQGLQLRNMFGPKQGQQSPTFPSPFRSQSMDMSVPTIEQPPDDPSFLAKYLSELSRAPKAEPVSGWRRFGAGLAGGLAGYAGGPQVGIETASNIVRAPHDEKMTNYQRNLQHLGAGAQLETSLDKQRFDQFIKMMEAEREDRNVDSNITLRNAQAGKATAETEETLGNTPSAQLALEKVQADIDKIKSDIERNPSEIANLDARTAQINQEIEQNADLSPRERLNLQGEWNTAIANIYANARGTSADSELEQTRRRDNELRRIANDPNLMEQYRDFIDVRRMRGETTISLKPPKKGWREDDAQFQQRVRKYDELRQRIGEVPRSRSRLSNDNSGALDFLRQNYPNLTNPTPEDIAWAEEQLGG